MRQYAQSAISGGGKSTLTCMTGDCILGFPRAQVEMALDAKSLAALDEREQEESIRLGLADIVDGGQDGAKVGGGGGEELAECPHCSFKCFLPSSNKVIQVRFFVL